MMPAILIVLSLSAAVVIFWFAMKILRKLDDVANILMDLRDGTKTVYREKRKAVRAEDITGDISVKIAGRESREPIGVLNIGYDGALLRTRSRFQVGDILDLTICLPLFPQPIHVKSKVKRAEAIGPQEKPTGFDIGIEYFQIDNADRQKLIETVDVINKGR